MNRIKRRERLLVGILVVVIMIGGARAHPLTAVGTLRPAPD
jgi:hypothetical protein